MSVDGNISQIVLPNGTTYDIEDSTVPSWAKASSKPSYSLSEITGTSDLQAIEGLTGTSGLLKKTAADTWTLDTNTYLTSFTETDPVFSASAAAGITSLDISNWNSKTSHSTQTATLTTTWTSNQQTVTVSGVTSSNYVVVSPAPASYDDYCEAGIYCSAQSTNSLTFKCDTAPSSSLTVNVMIIG